MTVDVLTQGYSRKGADNFNVNPFNMPITIGAGSNRMLLVGVAVDPVIPSNWVDPIKYAGTALAEVTGGAITQAAQHIRWFYRLEAGLTTGVSNLTVNEGWTQNLGVYFWAVVENALQAAPTAVTAAEWANAALSATVSTPANGLALALMQTQSSAGAVISGTTAFTLDVGDGTASGKVNWGYTTGSSIGFTTGVNQDKVLAALVISPLAAAATLSSPTTVSTGNTIATVRVTTDTAPTGSSILAVQVLPAADATPTAAAILASPTQTITSGASGARDFNLTGLTNGTAYKAHFAQTGPSNVVSTASFTPSTVPGAPTIGTAVAGNAQATVNGTAPGSTGGSAITGYRSTATPGGSTVTGASLPITHTGLTNGAAYTFTLAAQNANGYGAESAASNSVTPSSGADVTPPTLGGSITIGTVTSSSIQASWSAGSDNVAVTSYEVSSNGGGSYSDVGNVLTYTFTGLAPSTSYALRVRAKDAAGNVSSALSATQSTGAAPSSITGTFTLPGADDRTDKQEVTLHTVQALSSLTVDGNGATVNGAPASLAANGFFRLRFDAQSVAWYRVG